MKTKQYTLVLMISILFTIASGCRQAETADKTTTADKKLVADVNRMKVSSEVPEAEELYKVDERVSVVGGETEKPDESEPIADPTNEDKSGEVAVQIKA